MSSKLQFKLDTLRTLAFGAISGAYANIGAVTAFPATQLIFFNQTNVPLIFSDAGGNDKVPVAAGQVVTIACSYTGQNPQNPSPMSVQGTQWQVRSIGSPASGAAYLGLSYLT